MTIKRHQTVASSIQRHPRRLTAGLIPLGLAAASTVLAWAATAPVAQIRAPGPVPVDALVAALAAAGGAALLATYALATLACWCDLVLRHCPRVLRRVGVALAPAGLRRALCLCLGAGMLALPATAAHASDSGGVDHGSYLVDRPARPAEAEPGRAGWTVRVLPGDSLWGIASRSLGAGASERAVARNWPRWYAANRATIGPDPDLLRPGQRLHAPVRRTGGANR